VSKGLDGILIGLAKPDLGRNEPRNKTLSGRPVMAGEGGRGGYGVPRGRDGKMYDGIGPRGRRPGAGTSGYGGSSEADMDDMKQRPTKDSYDHGDGLLDASKAFFEAAGIDLEPDQEEKACEALRTFVAACIDEWDANG
jgi:hypothetical protein